MNLLMKHISKWMSQVCASWRIFQCIGGRRGCPLELVGKVSEIVSACGSIMKHVLKVQDDGLMFDDKVGVTIFGKGVAGNQCIME